jgi:hypothetical protein
VYPCKYWAGSDSTEPERPNAVKTSTFSVRLHHQQSNIYSAFPIPIGYRPEEVQGNVVTRTAVSTPQELPPYANRTATYSRIAHVTTFRRHFVQVSLRIIAVIGSRDSTRMSSTTIDIALRGQPQVHNVRVLRLLDGMPWGFLLIERFPLVLYA